jgi:NhaA family Na+:H+ antiporter
VKCVRRAIDWAVTIVLVVAAIAVLAGQWPPWRILDGRPLAPDPGRGLQVDPDLLVRWQEAGHRIGPVGAPIQIVEFANVLCGFCAKFHHALDSLFRRYPSMLSVTWLHFVPPAVAGSDARTFALALECAAEQERFDAFLDLAFTSGLRVPAPDTLEGIARAAEVPRVEDFKRCLAVERYGPRIDAQSGEARAAGFDGTPTWTLNGRLYVGAPPTATLDSIVVSVLRGR